MGPRREDMRAADADRQRVADQLRAALDEGRLDLTEYDDRVQQAFAARTYGDLDGLLHDLPPVTPAAQAQVATTPPGPPAAVQPASAGRMGGPILAMWASWLTATLVCTVVWLLTDPRGYPWPVWVAGPWGAVLLGRTILLYAGADRRDRGRGTGG